MEYGISFVGSATISGNWIRNYGRSGAAAAIAHTAIIVNGNTGCTVSANRIESGPHGIIIANAAQQLTIQRNTGTELTGYGLYFLSWTGDDVVITGNTLGGETAVYANRPAETATVIVNSNT